MSTQTQQACSLADPIDNQTFRQWLQAAGMRFSMPRLKVVEALYGADAQGVSSRELHQRLSDAGEPLSLVSVRQVLRRMQDHGLVEDTGQSRYRLITPA
ncbi:Fur family transcriptional regulator [Pseudomonas sp. 8Z]|uniref:transcriptional repressor n=1 Tax=Pseudomonas sp. 8Z TaxID=2653166 RepID=UPI0012F3F4AD|nr:transcriptional repressor [Pseudomonas sp. 8Z]VXC42809.1 Fur family transcriptional regulator [Pseudomonas sp. 8Z]